ncbi:PTS sugar transporter subunit IIB [Vagococcus salmoninarum]|uniref:PTS sugar transporter subunit IIB n=1 Tax=Vagococcus salmoninarum TaxID=2739 RepID=UPI003F97D67C
MTKKIILACAGGFSTSMLVERMLTAAKAQKIEVVIEATAEGKLDKYIDSTDILLLGPQVGYLEASLKEKYRENKVAITTILSIDYGMMNGEKVLKDAIALYDSLNMEE